MAVVVLDLEVDTGKTQLLLLESVKNVVRNDSSHSVQLPGQLELLDKGGGDHGGGGAGDAGLAVEDDGAGGGGVLQHGHDLVKVGLDGGLLLVGGDPDGLELGHLLLDGSIDLIKSGDSSKLLGDLLIVSSLLRMFTKLILEELEVITPLLDFLSKSIFKASNFLRVVHLKMKIDGVTVEPYHSEWIGRISGCERFSIDIDNRFLSKVDPEDVFLISILLEDC